MKNRRSNFAVIALAVFCQIPAGSLAQSEHGRGHPRPRGGDDCEKKIKEIRDGIRTDWIEKAEVSGVKDPLFKLQYGVSKEEYINEMKRVLAPGAVTISCVKETPENNYMPVMVGGVPKTCMNFAETSKRKAKILCDYERFLNLVTLADASARKKQRVPHDDADRYPLIHHEFDSIHELIEKSPRNDIADSDYYVSDQITKFGGWTSVYKLGFLRRTGSNELPSCRIIANSTHADVETGTAMIDFRYHVVKTTIKDKRLRIVPFPTSTLKKFEETLGFKTYKDPSSPINGYEIAEARFFPSTAKGHRFGFIGWYTNFEEKEDYTEEAYTIEAAQKLYQALIADHQCSDEVRCDLAEFKADIDAIYENALEASDATPNGSQTPSALQVLSKFIEYNLNHLNRNGNYCSGLPSQPLSWAQVSRLQTVDVYTSEHLKGLRDLKTYRAAAYEIMNATKSASGDF